MASLRGERFNIDLSSDDEDLPPTSAAETVPERSTSSLPAFVKDVKEKPTNSTILPAAPSGDKSQNGFPAHKKRTGTSRFKQARIGTSTFGSFPPGPPLDHRSPSTGTPDTAFEEEERRKIDLENRRRIAQMSEQEIEQERRELMQGLPTSLIERLLRRANIDDDQPMDYPIPLPEEDGASPDITSQAQVSETRKPKKRVAFDTSTAEQAEDDEECTSPSSMPSEPDTAAIPIHFPRPPSTPAPTLDPASPSFLSDLHTKYFPDLPVDPAKLAWMTTPDTTTDTAWSSYSPSASSVPVSAFRFSFAGALLPPSTSAAIPTTKGLHHHGAAPSAAGYTIGELAHLARSSFPSQRCLAFQTLGRVLYRLGVGEYRQGEEGDSVERGLWGCIRDGRVLETLQEEAERPKGHASSKAYALDALWLWRKGGGASGEIKAQ